MPPDRVLTETDGPLARRGHSPLMPWDVKEAEVVLGTLWKLPSSEVKVQLSLNLRRLVSTWAQGQLEQA